MQQQKCTLQLTVQWGSASWCIPHGSMFLAHWGCTTIHCWSLALWQMHLLHPFAFHQAHLHRNKDLWQPRIQADHVAGEHKSWCMSCFWLTAPLCFWERASWPGSMSLCLFGPQQVYMLPPRHLHAQASAGVFSSLCILLVLHSLTFWVKACDLSALCC